MTGQTNRIGNGWTLAPNHSNAGPETLVFFDTETRETPDPDRENGVIQTLRLGCATGLRLVDGQPTRRRSITFRTTDEFWEFVQSFSHKTRPVFLFAHNVGYDLQVVDFFSRFGEGEFTVKGPSESGSERKGSTKGRRPWRGFLVIDDPPTIINVRHRDGWRLNILDTMNWFKCSLADLGKRLGYEKQAFPGFDTDDSTLQMYCQRDVEILERTIVQYLNWLKGEELGKFRVTAPSQAWATLRHRFYDHPITQHNDQRIKDVERQSYFGGRLELFKRGVVDEPVFGLDVNSMYPYIMQESLFPVRLMRQNDRIGPTGSIDDLSSSTIAEVLIECESDGFPLRVPRLGTIYPIGTYWTTLAGPELMRAVAQDVVREVGRWSSYLVRPLFRSFVQWGWDARQKAKASGDVIQDQFIKLLMNSCYGKAGQKSAEWVESDVEIPGVEWGQWIETHTEQEHSGAVRVIAGNVQLSVERGEHKQAYPAIAAFVTAYAREYIRHLMRIAGAENVYYVVTDAIYVNETGRDRLAEVGMIDESELGMLAVEKEGWRANFESIHWYTVGDHGKHGSRKASAVMIDPSTVTELQFAGLASLVRRGPIPGGGVRVARITKRYSKMYERGLIDADGTIHPLRIDQPMYPFVEPAKLDAFA